MATTITTNITTGGGINALGVLFDRKVINSLQPALYFESLATVRTVAQGNYTDRFAMFDQIATGSVTSLGEGVNPVGVAVTLTTGDITPSQYGISVEVSDLVVLTTFIDLLTEASTEVGYAIARKIDSVLQTVFSGGPNVYYAGGKTARVQLAAGDLLDANLIVKAGQKLVKGSAPRFADGFYRAVGTVEQIYDLKSNSSIGQWVDIAKYAQPTAILNGEIGSLNGVRIMQSPNVDTFSSFITVHPMYVTGMGAVRISYWLPNRVKSYIIPPEQSNIANPLGQKGSIGAKTNIGGARTQDARMTRVETAATTL